MSETRAVLMEMASRVFSDLCTRRMLDDAERGVWPEKLWTALESTGLAAAARADTGGGARMELDDLAALLRLGGFHCAPVPLAETWLAGRMLDAAELSAPNGPLSVGPVLSCDRLMLERSGNGWTLDGVLHRVPWGRHARAIVALANSADGVRTVVIEDPPLREEGWNYAREPRDTLHFDAYRCRGSSVGAPGRGYRREQLLFEGALFRAIAMAGALEKVLQLTVRYAGERVQFGRPIGKFQAVQQQIAVLATQAALATAAAHGAADALRSGPAFFEMAAAKSSVGEAADIGASIAHQVHAAIGFTKEHALQLSTRRLWSWRDEFGNEAEWQEYIGRLVAGVGGEDLWRFVSAPGTASEGQRALARTHADCPCDPQSHLSALPKAKRRGRNESAAPPSRVRRSSRRK